MKTIYVAQKNSDTVEGRGIMIDIAGFTRNEDATQVSKEQNLVMGKPCPPCVKELLVYDDLDDFATNETDVKIRKALNKLTDKEKELLTEQGILN